MKVMDSNKLLDAMRKNNVSQEELATGAGISPATVSRIVNGKSMSRVRTVYKISAFLGCAPSELVEVAK